MCCVSHITCFPGSDTQDMGLARSYGPLKSLCELERRVVRRPLKRVGRVVFFAAPLLACAVSQSCWTSLCGIALCRRHHTNHRAHMVVGPIADAKLTPVSHIATEFVGCVDDMRLVACILLAAR